MMQTTSRPARTRTAKPRTPATVRLVDINAGTYRVLSSDGVTWYDVNAAEGTCTCKAFVDFARVCRHVRAATITMDMHRSLRLGRQPMMRLSGAVGAVPAPRMTRTPKATWRRCSECGTSYYGTLVSGWCACLPQAEDGPKQLTPRQGGAVALLECFAS